MAFERLIKVARIAAHAIRMGLLVSFVALGSIALWAFANRPDMGWSDALVADLAEGPVPASRLGVTDWQVICQVPQGLDPRDVLQAETGTGFTECQGWRSWFPYYPDVAALGASGPTSCAAWPVPAGLLRAQGDTPLCHRRAGFTQLIRQGERLAVTTF